MFKRWLLILLLLLSSAAIAQTNIAWMDISGQHGLPAGVKLFRGERASPLLKAWYLVVDLNQPDLVVRPYIGSPKGLTSFTQDVGAFAAINGGYFGGTASVSSVVYPGEVRAQNIAVVNRNGTSYTLTRSFFGLNPHLQPSVDWIYHFDATIGGLYRFGQPTNNQPGAPAPQPDSSDGSRYTDLLTGIGGGPTLIKDGQAAISYNEEVFFGSGVGFDNRDPRTAVGYTAEGRVVLLVVDGRDAAWSEGVGMPELADILLELGCMEAMNLDGGGSTQMAVGSALINRPEGGTFQRAVPTILAVTHFDSLNLPPVPVFEQVIDTEDPQATMTGAGWFASANAGFWGGTPALLTSRGDGNSFVDFRPSLPARAEYEVYAWWVAASNRCTDTPVVVQHAGGRDTVRVDQTGNSARWNFIGSYTFSGDAADAVLISNAATNGQFVVADAVRLVSFDSSAVVGIASDEFSQAQRFRLQQNYPNPFNPATVIRYQLSYAGNVTLRIYNLQGQEIRTLVNARKAAGDYAVTWNGRDHQGQPVASGIYIYRLKADRFLKSRKMLLVK